MGQALHSNAHFDAVIYPNQPLSVRQSRIILAISAMVALIMGIFFVVAGAWPIAGFFGLDIAALYIAFKLIRKKAARTERVKLDENGLLIEANDGRGQSKHWLFEPYWVRVHMDDPPSRHSLVTLRSHGTMLSLGAFLTPDERLRFAKALRSALRQWR